MKILIVEDNSDTSLMIEETIEDMDGAHEVIGTFSRAEDVEAFVKENRPDFVFMDIDLAGNLTGIECAIMLEKRYKVPSLFITGHEDEIANTMAIDSLYFLNKPFEPSHIRAAVLQAQQKLRNKIPENVKKVTNLGDYEFDFEHETLKAGKEKIQLSKKELKLVYILFENLGNTVDNEAIKRHVWEDDSTKDSALTKLVSRTREKLTGLNIQSHPNIGYCVEVES